MKLKLLQLTFGLALLGAAAAAQAQTHTTLNDPPGGNVPVRYLGNFLLLQTAQTTSNDFTNRMVRCTPEYYTNNQAATHALIFKIGGYLYAGPNGPAEL